MGAAPFQYATPKDWEDLGPRDSGGIRSLASFRSRDRAVETTVTMLPGEAGGLAANVNRWRQQLGLPPADAAALQKDLRTVEVSGTRGYVADLNGYSGKRMLGAVVPHGGQTWFFKMTGPADAVGRQRDAFEAFLKSVRFDGASKP
jgi:hypothetical protein